MDEPEHQEGRGDERQPLSCTPSTSSLWLSSPVGLPPLAGSLLFRLTVHESTKKLLWPSPRVPHSSRRPVRGAPAAEGSRRRLGYGSVRPRAPPVGVGAAWLVQADLTRTTSLQRPNHSASGMDQHAWLTSNDWCACSSRSILPVPSAAGSLPPRSALARDGEEARQSHAAAGRHDSALTVHIAGRGRSRPLTHLATGRDWTDQQMSVATLLVPRSVGLLSWH